MMKLETRSVEKPWGRIELPVPFEAPGPEPIGEIWFAAPDERQLPLLVKYIFTSEALSIQVHPDDEQARARGQANGKSECWLILDAEPGAVLGLGLKQRTEAAELRAAAIDGSIETMMDWKPVVPGDFFYVPAGTVHAIGAGISLLEIQQSSDVTYRLYDYGRPRELHLDEGIGVSKAEPYPQALARHGAAGQVLLDGPIFTVLRVEEAVGDIEKLRDRDRWVLPIAGSAEAGGGIAGVGECLLVAAGEPFRQSEDAILIVAAAGPLASGTRAETVDPDLQLGEGSRS